MDSRVELGFFKDNKIEGILLKIQNQYNPHYCKYRQGKLIEEIDVDAKLKELAQENEELESQAKEITTLKKQVAVLTE